MSNLNEYKLVVKKGDKTVAVHKVVPYAGTEDANWTICNRGGTSLGLHCPTKKDVQNWCKKKYGSDVKVQEA